MFSTDIYSKCQGCKKMWKCFAPHLLAPQLPFWEYIIDVSSKVIGTWISNDPTIWVLGNTDLLYSSQHK